MSMIDELQRLLDDAGLEWRSCGDDGSVYRANEYVHFAWKNGERVYKVYRLNDDDGTLCIDGLTPEQAIAATLGSGTCVNMDEETDAEWFTCSECNTELRVHEPFDAFSIHFCPNCGRRVEVDA